MHDQRLVSGRELVMRIAYHMIARMPTYVDVDDLIQAGSIGLLDAIKSFDDTKGASFDTYAGIRIKGAMIDELRKGDWTPRSTYRFERALGDATRQLMSSLGRSPTNEEIALAMDMPTEELQAKLADVSHTKLASFDDQDVQFSPAIKFSNEVDQALILEKVQTVIGELEERDQIILSLYYFEELNLKEIGKVLEVSESRVSQLLSKAVSEIRDRLE